MGPATKEAQLTGREPQPNLAESAVPLRLWPAILLTGAGAGLLGGLLMKLLRLAQHLSYHYVTGDFLSGVEQTSAVHRLVVMVCAGALAAAALLALKLAGARSTDINEAVWEKHGEFKEGPTAWRAVLSIVVVGMGAAIGREQALKQGGALAAARVAAWLGITPEQRRLLVACGIGAGMAAAYNVPFGGALFTLEVLLGTLSLSTVLAAFVTSFVATGVSWLMLPDRPTYELTDLHTSGMLVVWALLAGPILGALSVAFVRAVRWGKDHKPEGAGVLLWPLGVFFALGLAAMKFPQVLGNGKNVVQLALDWRMSTGLLVWLLVLRPLATTIVLRAGVPGGLFTPTATFGALAAAVLGQGWSHVAPAIDKRCYAPLGVAAVLAATSQGPISAVAFTVELTYRGWPLIVPMLLAVAGATITYRGFESKSIYEAGG